MKVHRIEIPKSCLEQLSEEERRLFLLIGHLANEINVLQKLLVCCSPGSTDDEINKRANNMQAVMLVKLLAGKLNEGWELTRKAFFRSGLSRTYEPLLSEEGTASLHQLKRYFGSNNLINKVRNRFAFHYSPHHLRTAFLLPLEEGVWEFYLSESSGNCLYHASEEAIMLSLWEDLDPGNPQQAMNRLMDETIKIARSFVEFIDSLIICFMDRYLLSDEDNLPMEEIDIGRTPTLGEVKIPFFVKRPSH